MLYGDDYPYSDDEITTQDARGNDVILDDMGLLIVPASTQDKRAAMNLLVDVLPTGHDGYPMMHWSPFRTIADTLHDVAHHPTRSN